MGLRIEGEVERVNGKEMSYKEFVERYVEKKKPVVLTGLMDDWRGCIDWVSEDGKPNLLFFSTHFGKSIVQVADCSQREFTDQKRVEMSVSEFIDQWNDYSSKEHVNANGREDPGKSLLYLKDWHFVKEYPEYVAYRTPLFFSDDWLNLYLDSHHLHKDPDTFHGRNEIDCSDYRFVYMGKKGTWTPLHADVFRSYSWSANICGKKHWYFLSPAQCHHVFDRHVLYFRNTVFVDSHNICVLRNMKSSVYNILEDVSETTFPGFKKAIWLECIQEKNEIIFVPSGWYHQVHNLEDTISINHNWFNACNLSWVWKLLLEDYNEAKEYIEDIRDICDDFEGLCQRNLAANTGMNFSDFFIFATHFTFANLVQLYFLIEDCGYPISGQSAEADYLISNLVSIREIALEMRSIESLTECCSVLLDFREVLKNTKFLELCIAFDKTYMTIDEDSREGYNPRKPLRLDSQNLDFIRNFGKVSSPEDLITVIDNAAENLATEFGMGSLRSL
ncbi:hypothetical protein GIB67_004350 [Kingdonia uniflora]|uniref:JmjC domain-containing protein n=1 Tax=Kingdonia uniflora TaxID=39325 RepID=A0A7J7MRK0_9MAGN|nr:hypothetical protein GIB67_004350 [Kingdonia uniflora]